MPFQVIFSRSQFNFFPVQLAAIPDKTTVCGSTILAADLANDEFTFNALGEDFSPYLLAGEMFDVTRAGNTFNIVSVNTGTDEFTIDTGGADYSSRYTGGFKFRVQLTSGGANNGIWTASSAGFSGGNTVIQVAEDITVDTGPTASGFTTSLNGSYTTVSATVSDPYVSVKVAEDIDHDLDPGTLANADVQWVKATLLGGDSTGHTFEWEVINGPAVDFLSNPGPITLAGQTDIYVIFARTPFGNDDREFRLWIDRGTPSEQYDDMIFEGWPTDECHTSFEAPSVSSSPVSVQVPRGGYGSECRQLDCNQFRVTAAFPLVPHHGESTCSATSFFIGFDLPDDTCEGADELVGWVVEELQPAPSGAWVDVSGVLPPTQNWYYAVTTGRSYRIRVYYDMKQGQPDFRGFGLNYAVSCSKWLHPDNLNGIYSVSAASATFEAGPKNVTLSNYTVEILSQGSCSIETSDANGTFYTGKLEHSKATTFTELLTAGSCSTETSDSNGTFYTGKSEHSRVPIYSVVPLDGSDPGG